MEIALGIIMVVLTLVLAGAVLLQSGKDKRLSSSISGSGMSETFFGKSKAKTADKIATYVTIIGGILFVILDVILYVYLIA